MPKLSAITHWLLLILLSSSIFFACSEDEEQSVEPETPTVTPGANDESARNEIDASYESVMQVVEKEGQHIFLGRVKDEVLPCGVFTVDTTANGMLIRYDSTKNCSKKVLGGTVQVRLIQGSAFRDTGAVLEMEYQGYTVEFMANGEVIEFNGTIQATNQTGGVLGDITTMGRIEHSQRGTLSLTFRDGSAVTRKWRITKKRVYQQDSLGDWSTTTFALQADSANIVEKGITKEGNPFHTEVNTALTWKNCGSDFTGPFVLYQGSWTWVVPGEGKATAEAGYRFDNGQAILSQDCESEGYKIDFNFSGQNTTRFQYY